MDRENRTKSSEFRVASSEQRRSPFSRNSQLATRAFTLTELLVVITIIAILAALITAGAVNALNASKRAAITLEIGQLADGIERFKNEQGGAYPPNATNLPTAQALVINDFIRSFRKAFPRHNENENLLRVLAGQTTGIASGYDTLPQGMNAAEALYFWLGGFSADPVYPISGAGGPAFDPSVSGEVLEGRNRLYEFDLARLGPRNNSDVFSGRTVTYPNPTGVGGNRLQINFWTYFPKNSTSSFAYFDASRHDPVSTSGVTYDFDLSGALNAGIFAIKKVKETGWSTPNRLPTDVHFVNKGKYQILHAGLDNAWGKMSDFSMTVWDPNPANDKQIRFPTGPFTGDIADTLTNFTPGTLESAQE
jgi:prepilin-type N-terminal cleavage/methylation domain-containing protein